MREGGDPEQGGAGGEPGRRRPARRRCRGRRSTSSPAKTNRNAPATSNAVDPGRAEPRAREHRNQRGHCSRRQRPGGRRGRSARSRSRRRRAAARRRATRTVRSPNSGARTRPISGPSAIMAPAPAAGPAGARVLVAPVARGTRRARAPTIAAARFRQQPTVGRRSGNRRGRQHQVMLVGGARRDARGPRRGQDAAERGVGVRSEVVRGRTREVEQHLTRGDVVVVDGEPLEELEALRESRRTQRRRARCCAAAPRARRRWSPPDRSATRRASRPAAVR